MRGEASQAKSREIHPRQEEPHVKTLNCTCGSEIISDEELKAVLAAGAQQTGEHGSRAGSCLLEAV